MSDLLHKLVSALLTGALVAFVGWLSVTVRKRKVQRAEAAAPAPVEDRSQALLRHAQQADHDRDRLASAGRPADAVAQARMAVEQWSRLAELRPGRFQAERQNSLRRLGDLLAQSGQADEATRVRQEAARAV
ncbi:hypothetical protein FPZ12_005740 [Amycolatopsis acidicola]|uniref:Tetratricopeptide repeat protein n=1 Tax=Amycolatopsis acidicola TaxID=2596893 RepID=A0A5N0VGU3_9PSEU|nr:hypothetical protein [Amycolatopsis acidicola]KAA9165567.1 hypothetical protein FPZ12_005740 [Amycolatopsis acidicola]